MLMTLLILTLIILTDSILIDRYRIAYLLSIILFLFTILRIVLNKVQKYFIISYVLLLDKWKTLALFTLGVYLMQIFFEKMY